MTHVLGKGNFSPVSYSELFDGWSLPAQLSTLAVQDMSVMCSALRCSLESAAQLCNIVCEGFLCLIFVKQCAWLIGCGGVLRVLDGRHHGPVTCCKKNLRWVMWMLRALAKREASAQLEKDKGRLFLCPEFFSFCFPCKILCVTVGSGHMWLFLQQLEPNPLTPLILFSSGLWEDDDSWEPFGYSEW